MLALCVNVSRQLSFVLQIALLEIPKCQHKIMWSLSETFYFMSLSQARKEQATVVFLIITCICLSLTRNTKSKNDLKWKMKMTIICTTTFLIGKKTNNNWVEFLSTTSHITCLWNICKDLFKRIQAFVLRKQILVHVIVRRAEIVHIWCIW